MPLEDLVRLIERLSQQIAQYNKPLRKSEALTRYVLVNPLLKGLGWDTEDPARVIPEFPVKPTYPGSGSDRRADYALMGPQQPVALVEVKKLGEPLEAIVDQAVNYCNTENISYMIITDGDKWQMYEVFKRARIDERKVMDISLVDPSYAATAIKTLSIWRPTLHTGKVEVPPTIAFQAPAPSTGMPSATPIGVSPVGTSVIPPALSGGKVDGRRKGVRIHVSGNGVDTDYPSISAAIAALRPSKWNFSKENGKRRLEAKGYIVIEVP